MTDVCVSHRMRVIVQQDVQSPDQSSRDIEAGNRVSHNANYI